MGARRAGLNNLPQPHKGEEVNPTWSNVQGSEGYDKQYAAIIAP